MPRHFWVDGDFFTIRLANRVGFCPVELKAEFKKIVPAFTKYTYKPYSSSWHFVHKNKEKTTRTNPSSFVLWSTHLPRRKVYILHFLVVSTKDIGQKSSQQTKKSCLYTRSWKKGRQCYLT
eukprot:Lithocolla_globosa_v1_NODE_968_length_3010_cov_26.681218.p5 type:complete len:121 gc:universal NODE_968_length_3010_cov_26.681218:2568-2206(-)